MVPNIQGGRKFELSPPQAAYRNNIPLSPSKQQGNMAGVAREGLYGAKRGGSLVTKEARGPRSRRTHGW